MMSRNRKIQGFTLLEAVVAMAIFSVGAVAVYGGVNANLIALGRVHEINLKANAIDSAVDFMSTVDIIDSPNGESRIGQLVIEWQSGPVFYEGDARDESGNLTVNRVNLRETDVTLSHDEQVIGEFTLSMLGIYQVRTANDAIFN